MARVVDYAWGRPSVAALKATGCEAVCRYLSWLPNGKCLSRVEADGLRAGGIDVISNWEYFGDWLHDYSGGFATGVAHATEASAQHLACGGPPSRPIYFSADFDVPIVQQPTVADYYRGVASVIGLGRTGAYGSYRTVKYLLDVGVITWAWQTYAWSTFRDVPAEPAYLHWDPRAQVRQVRNGVLIDGVDCDLDDPQAADYGQWGYSATTAPDEEDTMGASTGPIEIKVGANSYTLPPAEAGAADPRPAWVNVTNDTYGKAYTLRIYASVGDGSFFPLNGDGVQPWPVAAGGDAGVLVFSSSRRYSCALPKGTCALSIVNSSSVPLSFCIERGAVIK